MGNVCGTLSGDVDRWNRELGIEGLQAPVQVGGSIVWMGGARAEPFSPVWLSDYRGVLEHVYTEHALHVKGLDEEREGLTWHSAKFATAASDTPDLNPEKHCQMRLGYFLVPEEHLSLIESEIGADTRVQSQMRVEVAGKIYYRFFVHPDAYPFYAHLEKVTQLLTPGSQQASLQPGKELYFVRSDDSAVMGTPSSSYRSWVIRDVADPEANVPFIIKMGVPCFVLGSDRWLSDGEIERSVMCQRAFDRTHDSSERQGALFRVFGESMGVNLKHPLYRDSSVNVAIEGGKSAPVKPSGNLVREFPREVLNGQMKVASCAALMSVEAARGGTEPWIVTLAKKAIERGEVRNIEEFLEKHFIRDYLEAIAKVTFEEGLTLEPHSQNLCVLLSPDNERLLGFAYRDHGGVWVDLASRVVHDRKIDFLACGMTRALMELDGQDVPAKTRTAAVLKSQGAIEKAYIQSYAWFYRYQVLTKMLNTLITDSAMGKWRPPGAPHQIDVGGEVLEERLLSDYWTSRVVRSLSIEPTDRAFPPEFFGPHEKGMALSLGELERDQKSPPGHDSSPRGLSSGESTPRQVSVAPMSLTASVASHVAKEAFRLSTEQADRLLHHADHTYAVRYLDQHFMIHEVRRLVESFEDEGVAGSAAGPAARAARTMPDRIAQVVVSSLKVDPLETGEKVQAQLEASALGQGTPQAASSAVALASQRRFSVGDEGMLPSAEGGSGHEFEVTSWHRFFGSWRRSSVDRLIGDQGLRPLGEELTQLKDFSPAELIVKDSSVYGGGQLVYYLQKGDATLFFNGEKELVAVLPRLLKL